MLVLKPDSETSFYLAGGTLWDARMGQVLLNLKATGFVTDLAFSPDGQWLGARWCSGARLLRVR